MRTASLLTFDVARVLQQLSDLRHLESNWDSYGALPVHQEALRHAETFAHHLAGLPGVPQPTVTATGEGFIGFCWDSGRWSLDAEVRPDGRIDYVFIDEAGGGQTIESSTHDFHEVSRFLCQQG